MNEGPVLLVEDNPDDVLLTHRAFTQSGIANEIVTARDWDACRAQLLPDDGGIALRPVLVMLDINLHRVGGLEVLRLIRADQRTSSLPVIMLTTSREERDIAESYRLGANGFVRKPVGLAEFRAVIAAVGDYWLRVNVPPPPARRSE